MKPDKISKDPSPTLTAAANIITAVRDDNWEEMLELFPSGVEHRAYKYNTPNSFMEIEDYQDYARYVAPAREMMKEKCLNLALEYLNAHS